MKDSEIFALIDHTNLKPFATWNDIETLCKEAITYKMASVCIQPSYVKRVTEKFGKELTICTVIGFPLGYNTTETKIFETTRALEEGATEIDMVVNIGDIKDNRFDVVEKEIAELKAVVGDNTLKVIIEACYLTDDEKIKLCEIITRTKADFIKTSTGFGTSGAKIEDITLFKKHIGKEVKIKAAGGIKNKESLLKFINEGCDRIGTSSIFSMLE